MAATILVVDDQAVNREFLSTLLGYRGYRILEAANGAEGLAATLANRPDLVIADVVMPGIDGYEFVRQIRSDDTIALTRVMFYTAVYHEAKARSLAQACGVTQVLIKPSEPQDILAAVQTLLGSAGQPAGAVGRLEFEQEHKRLLTETLFEKVKELEEANEQLRELATRLQSIREEERTRVARRLHDELGQSLTALKMDCAWVVRKLEGADADVIRRAQSSVRLVDDTILMVRQLAADLRPGILDLGLQAAIEWQAEEFQTRSEIACVVDASIQAGFLCPKQEVHLFRIFQESLTNIARHSGASLIQVTLRQDPGVLHFEVKDNGRGISEDEISRRKSLGLLGMRERVSIIGGTFSIQGSPGHGTTIRVDVPLALREAKSAVS